jgi:hypothetical protein
MRRNVTKDVQPPSQERQRRTLSQEPDKRKEGSPDDEAVGEVIGVKDELREKVQRRRARSLSGQALNNPLGLRNVKQTERKEVRRHSQNEG